ncbi:hypothetical protein ACO0RG_001003 [Hanseniaspora osmophila]
MSQLAESTTASQNLPSRSSSTLTQLFQDKTNQSSSATPTQNTMQATDTSRNNSNASALDINKNGFSQSFIANNNAHTAVFGASLYGSTNINNINNIMSSSPMTLNSNSSAGTLNTHKSFAQKNYPSLSSSIPYSVPNSNPSPGEENNGNINNGNNNFNPGTSASSNNNYRPGSSGGSSSSLMDHYSGLLPNNIQQINSNVIQSPKVANVEPRFVITKQKLQEKQQQSANYHRQSTSGGSSSSSNNNNNNNNNNNGSKTLNHSSSFNKKPMSPSGSSSSSTSMGSHSRSRSGSLSSQLGNLFFNSSSSSASASNSTAKGSMNNTSSKPQSKLTSSLKNSTSSSSSSLSSSMNNGSMQNGGSFSQDSAKNPGNAASYSNSDGTFNPKSVGSTIEEQPGFPHADSSAISASVPKPIRARQSNIYSASRTPVNSLHINTSSMSNKNSNSNSNLTNQMRQNTPDGSVTPGTPGSLKNSHSSGIAKFFKKSSSSSSSSHPNIHGNINSTSKNNNAANSAGSNYGNRYSSSPSVSTFNTNAIAHGNGNGNNNGNNNGNGNKSAHTIGRDSRSNSNTSSTASTPTASAAGGPQGSSFTSSTFNGPSSLGNTDILYQASNTSLNNGSQQASVPSTSLLQQAHLQAQNQQQQQQQQWQQKQSASLPFHKRYVKTGDDLGAGAGGTVKVFKRLVDKHLFAVKEFRSKYENERKKDYIKKITGEYCIGTTLKHPNIIATIEIVYDENRIFQVMEYCDYDLFAIVMSNKMSYDEICCCFKQILNGVEYLHSIGLAHRDLKLDNCVVDQHGIVKLIDFGASVVFSYPFSKNLVTASGIVGSDPYLAPEVCIFTKYDPRPVDVWSTAMIFVCMVLKKFPWKIPKLKDSSFKLFCSGRDCDSLSQLVTRTPNPPQYEESETGAKESQQKPQSSSNNAKDPNNLNVGPQRLLHNLPEESQHIIGRMVDLAPACRANIDEIMNDPWVESIKMCFVDENNHVVCPNDSHKHTVVDQSIAHIAGLEKNKNK